jgi:hypothetical protein
MTDKAYSSQWHRTVDIAKPGVAFLYQGKLGDERSTGPDLGTQRQGMERQANGAARASPDISIRGYAEAVFPSQELAVRLYDRRVRNS